MKQVGARTCSIEESKAHHDIHTLSHTGTHLIPVVVTRLHIVHRPEQVREVEEDQHEEEPASGFTCQTKHLRPQRSQRLDGELTQIAQNRKVVGVYNILPDRIVDLIQISLL